MPTHAYDSEYQSIYFKVYSVEVNDKKTIIELSERARSRIKKSLIRVTVKRKELHKIKKKLSTISTSYNLNIYHSLNLIKSDKRRSDM